VAKLVPPDGADYDLFGGSVAIDGENAVVGAPYHDSGFTNAGAAYIFSRNHGGPDTWGMVKKLTAPDAGTDAAFGFLAADRERIVIGAPSLLPWPRSQSGAAYIYDRYQGGLDNWGLVKKITAPDAEAGDHFGFGVSLYNGITIVGSSWEDEGGTDAGAAYVFY
jgi:hypothetical protein